MVENPAYDVVHVQGSVGDGLAEPDYNMENNPLYEMRIKSNQRHSHKTETAAGAGVYENMALRVFVFPQYTCLQTGIIIIRASVDALCGDGESQISLERVQFGRLTRQGTAS